MALNTFTAGNWGGGVTSYAWFKSLISIVNTSNTNFVKVWKIWHLNNSTSAIPGLPLLIIQIDKITAHSGGTSLTPIQHDTGMVALPAEITVKTAATVTLPDPPFVWRRYLFAHDEPSANAGTLDEWNCPPELNVVWDMGTSNLYSTPVILRQDEGITLRCMTNTTDGFADYGIMFSVE